MYHCHITSCGSRSQHFQAKFGGKELTLQLTLEPEDIAPIFDGAAWYIRKNLRRPCRDELLYRGAGQLMILIPEPIRESSPAGSRALTRVHNECPVAAAASPLQGRHATVGRGDPHGVAIREEVLDTELAHQR